MGVKRRDQSEEAIAAREKLSNSSTEDSNGSSSSRTMNEKIEMQDRKKRSLTDGEQAHGATEEEREEDDEEHVGGGRRTPPLNEYREGLDLVTEREGSNGEVCCLTAVDRAVLTNRSKSRSSRITMIQSKSMREGHLPTHTRSGRKRTIFDISCNIPWRITEDESPKPEARSPSPSLKRRRMRKPDPHVLHRETRDLVRHLPHVPKDHRLLRLSRRWYISTRQDLVATKSLQCASASLGDLDRVKKILDPGAREMQRKVELGVGPTRIRTIAVMVMQEGKRRKHTLRTMIDSAPRLLSH
jgi:hypothetical protein